MLNSKIKLFLNQFGRRALIHNLREALQILSEIKRRTILYIILNFIISVFTTFVLIRAALHHKFADNTTISITILILIVAIFYLFTNINKLNIISKVEKELNEFLMDIMEISDIDELTNSVSEWFKTISKDLKINRILLFKALLNRRLDKDKINTMLVIF